MKYFNLNINQWECYLELFDKNLKLIQVIKRMRQIIEFKSSRKFDVNLSYNILGILKILKDMYEKMTKKIKEYEYFYHKKTFSHIQHSKTLLKIINKKRIIKC